jgi:predicted nucleotidyltransferase
MRISVQEQKAIRETADEVFGKYVKVILFGSRVHDTEKGGDIDLLIESTESAAMILKRKLPFLVTLKQRIGDRKIDVLVQGKDSLEKAIYKVAHRKSVQI